LIATASTLPDVRFALLADIAAAPLNIRFTPECVAKLFSPPKQAILIQG
jgi:hypothetical protein